MYNHQLVVVTVKTNSPEIQFGHVALRLRIDRFSFKTDIVAPCKLRLLLEVHNQNFSNHSISSADSMFAHILVRSHNVKIAIRAYISIIIVAFAISLKMLDAKQYDFYLHLFQKRIVCLIYSFIASFQPLPPPEWPPTTTVRPTRPTTTVRPPYPGVPAWQCPREGNDLIPDRYDCTIFHVCHRGGTTEAKRCSTGLHFDINSRECKLPRDALCYAHAYPPKNANETLAIESE